MRQDRFNVNTGRHLDPGDTPDSLFGSVEARILIDGAEMVVPAGLEASVISGDVTCLTVAVSGSGKTLQLKVTAAAEKPGPAGPVTTMREKEPPAVEGTAVRPEGYQAAYATTLGEGDLVNSNGVNFFRLRDFLIQDRTNVNMLGRRDPGDEKDGTFTTARQRRLFETAELLVDPGLVKPLLSRKPVAIQVYLNGDQRLLVARPDAGAKVSFRTLEDMVEERNWTVAAMVSARDKSAEAALRELVAMAELAYGRQREKPVIFRVTLAHFLMQQDRQAEVAPTLPEIEADFRAAAQRGVDDEAVFPVMGFLAEAYTATGNFDAAKKLLQDLLDEPGKSKWKLSEEQCSVMAELRRQLLSPGEAGAPTYDEALAEFDRSEADPSVTPIRRLILLNQVIALCPKRRGETFDSLFSRLEKLIAATDRGSDREALVSLTDSLVMLAFHQFSQGEFTAARQRSEEVLSLLNQPELQETPSGISARKLLVRLATVEGNAGEAEALARRHFEWAKTLFRPYDARLVELTLQLMELLADRGDAAGIEQVGDPLAAAVLADTDVPSPDLRVVWHGLLADMLFAAGDAEKADSWYRRLFEVANQDPRLHTILGESYSSWGLLYEAAGRYNRAEAIWTEGADRMLSDPERIRDYILLLQDLSLVRKHYRDEQGAIDIIEKAKTLALSELGADSPEYGVCCNNLVLPLNALGRRDEAMRMSDESLRVAAINPDREAGEQDELIFQNNRAILLMDTDPAAAAVTYGKIVAAMEAKRLDETQNFGLFLMNLGSALKETRRPDEAEAVFLRALEVFRNLGAANQRNISIILDALAELALRKGQLASAADLVRESVKLSEAYLKSASSIAAEADKLALGSLFDYGKGVNILLAAGELEEACELSLRTKGAILDGSIRDARLIQRIGEDETLKKRFVELRAKQRQFNRVALALQQGGQPAGDLPGLAKLRQEVNQLQSQLLIDGEKGKSPAGSADLKSVQKRLGNGECFLEFVQATDQNGEQYLGAFEISPSGLRWVRLAGLGTAELAVSDFRQAINAWMASTTDTEKAGIGARLEAASRNLNQLFFEPFVASGALKSRAVLCPDGVLHFVPFAVLLDEAGNFPGENLVLDYVVSARDFCRDNEDTVGRNLMASAVVIGGPDYRFQAAGAGAGGDAPDTAGPLLVDQQGAQSSAKSGIARSGGVSLSPLPGAEKEAELIAGTLQTGGAAVTLLTATAATEKALAGTSGPAILHVATHGVFFDLNFDSLVAGEFQAGVDPMLRGALALTGAQTAVSSWAHASFPDADNDGWLFAAEAVQLDLQGTELVTLSACETGIGSIASGEGVIGLRRAFLAAGAKHVLSTLWPIADEMTVQLMSDFYKRIGSGQKVSNAFAGAQGEALKSFRSKGAKAEAMTLFGAFVLNRSGN